MAANGLPSLPLSQWRRIESGKAAAADAEFYGPGFCVPTLPTVAGSGHGVFEHAVSRMDGNG